MLRFSEAGMLEKTGVKTACSIGIEKSVSMQGLKPPAPLVLKNRRLKPFGKNFHPFIFHLSPYNATFVGKLSKMQTVKFPYGISNIEKLIEQDFVFVDKTNYIELLEKEENYSIFLRPRRMGKSLFVSMLEYYYDILKKDKFDKIFSELYIGKNPTPMASSYRVLKFDFSGIDTQNDENTFYFFLEKIRSTLNTFMGMYNLLHEAERAQVLAAKSPGSMMNRFFDYLNLWKTKTVDEPKIYILIDEYDHFTNEILIRDLSEFKRSVTQDGYIRKFYEAIKIATQQGFVDRFFITGVSPITLDGLTSGFNIGKHLSGKKEFQDLMGFSETEVTSLLDLILADKTLAAGIMNDLKNWYNGYKFNVNAAHTVYNSDMVLYFLDNFKKEQSYPAQMLDPNIMSDYGKLSKLLGVADYQKNISVLMCGFGVGLSWGAVAMELEKNLLTDMSFL